MESHFHDGQRRLQDEFDTRRLADLCAARLVRDAINSKQRAFIESADMFFLASVDPQGRPTCSYKGGDPGFVRVLDEQTIAFPNYDGDGKFLSWGNASVNPNVALLFIDFMKGWRLRIHGVASIHRDDPLLKYCPEAKFIVHVKIREIFGNCPRYIHKYQPVERSSYVPRAGCKTPVPEWKCKPEWRDALPASDPARSAT